MKFDFKSLAEQSQFVKIAQAKAALDVVTEILRNAEKDVPRSKQSIASYVVTREAYPSEEPSYYMKKALAEYDAMDDAEKAELADLIDIHREERQASDHYDEVIKEGRNSQFEAVRQRSWENVDNMIARIETGRFKGQYLQKILYALSIGPFCPSDRENDMSVRFQTGDYEHYNLSDLLNTHWLIPSSGIHGRFGDRGSILTERGTEILERLTIKYGAPEAAAGFSPELQ